MSVPVSRLLPCFPFCLLFFLTHTQRPTDTDKTELIFCPAQQFGGDDFLQFGACCTDIEEGVVSDKFLAAGPLTPECAVLYLEVPYAAAVCELFRTSIIILCA